MNLRLFKREYQGYIMCTAESPLGLHMVFVRHDEVPLGTPIADAMHHIAKDAVKHGAIKNTERINLMHIQQAYRLFGIRITPWRLVYDFDTEDEEALDPHFLLM